MSMSMSSFGGFHFLHIFLLLPIVESAANDLIILLNCGASSTMNDTHSRTWNPDHRSRYVPGNAASISNAFSASHVHPSLPDLVPYQTARVFHSPFTYSFPVSSGHKFIHLYFYPDTYAGFDTSLSFFSVTANGFTLLSNFSAFLNSQKSGPFMKEFTVRVKGYSQRIDLTFSPNPNSFAFINGIEIVNSLPDDLYFPDGPIKFVSGPLFDLQNDTALETLYRLNVGGADIEDGTVMFQDWSKDDDYILGADLGVTSPDDNFKLQYANGTQPYCAPAIIYKTARTMGGLSLSLDWIFPVDTGFYYLFRFHFCEIEFTKVNQRAFNIIIDDIFADQADIIAWSGGNGIPIFKDYIKWVRDDGRRGKKDLRLSLIPPNESLPQYLNAMLNGLEIFKLNDSMQSH